MLRDIPIRTKTITNHFDSLNDGYSKTHFVAIKNEAEAIVRVCNRELGIMPILNTKTLPPEPPESKLKCRFCNLEFDTERGILAHESVKHRELWKQSK